MKWLPALALILVGFGATKARAQGSIWEQVSTEKYRHQEKTKVNEQRIRVGGRIPYGPYIDYEWVHGQSTHDVDGQEVRTDRGRSRGNDGPWIDTGRRRRNRGIFSRGYNDGSGWRRRHY
jgi:hypothetical protein